ncbi:MAG: adenylate kinase [Leptospiraceae bacterium]|nr:adenylate kinase [Leptospiraceae bacterium]
MKRLLFMGPPGAGKGTQAAIICDTWQIPQVSTGEILRAAVKNGTEMGRKAQEYMNSGQLVPDAVVIGIVEDRLQEADTKNGYVLDGFPRTEAQAEALDQMLAKRNQKLDCALNLSVPDEELIGRLLERAKKEGRADDTEEVIRQRLVTYNQSTRPLIDYYQKHGILNNIDGVGALDEITGRIKAVLESL